MSTIAYPTPYVAERIAEAIRREGLALKVIARKIGAGPRALKNWIEGRNPPHAAHLIALMRESDEVFKTVCELAGREPASFTAEQKEVLRKLAQTLGDA